MGNFYLTYNCVASMMGAGSGGFSTCAAGSYGISAPVITDTPSSTGGFFAAGTYFWVVTATNSFGETLASNEVSATLTGSVSSVTLNWPVVPNATGYKVYRGTTTGAEHALITTISSGSTLTYLDTGSGGSAASPPSSLSPTTIVLYSGTEPTDADTGLSGNTVLATLTCSNTPITTITNPGSKARATFASITNATAVATGTASFFRLITGTGIVVGQGDVGTTTNALVLNTNSISSGSTVSITSAVIDLPTGGSF